MSHSRSFPASSISKALGFRVNGFWRTTYFPLSVGLFGALFSFLVIPFAAVMPAYLSDLDELCKSGKITQNFTAIGYPAILLPAYSIGGKIGIVVFQAMVYILAVILVHRLFKQALGDFTPLLVLVVVGIAFHPYCLLNIRRINDNAVSLLLVVIYCFWLIKNKGEFPTKWSALLLGATTGIYFSIRPNAAAFCLIPFILLTLTANTHSISLTIPRILLFVASAFLVYSIISVAVKSSVFYWPNNGPYNLFAGNNPSSRTSFLQLRNGEYSIRSGLESYNMLPSDGDLQAVDGRVYTTLVVRFAGEQRLAFLENAAVKLFVFFAPDFRQAHNTQKKIIQTALALPSFLWLMLVITHWYYLRRIDSLLAPLIFAILFVLPFILTNADPRFRLPVLDVFFLVHAGFLISETLTVVNSRKRATFTPQPAAAN